LVNVIQKRCCKFTWSYRSKKWILNKRLCRYQKRCPKKLIKCTWRKLGNHCAQRFCSKTLYKNKKVFRIKKWKNRSICFEKRKFICKFNKVNNGCSVKNCCLTISFKGKVQSQKCRTHKPHCPLIIKRKCNLKEHLNKCIRKTCCRFFHRGAKVTKKCYKYKLKCPKKLKQNVKQKKKICHWKKVGKNCFKKIVILHYY